MANLADALRRKATPLEANFVHSVGVRLARGRGHRKRQDILCDGGTAADVGVGADAHELMHRTKRAHHSPFLYDDMTAQRRAVHQHAVVADNAVVSIMRIGHTQTWIP